VYTLSNSTHSFSVDRRPVRSGGVRNFIKHGQNKTMISFSDSRNRR